MISVVIPIYNAEKQLVRMLNSIKNQSYTNYEVIMIDDGSQDKSAAICHSFCQNDSRFCYYYQENQGVSIARNNGLKRSKGNYITFLDADDKIDKNYFEELRNACQIADVSVCDVVVEGDGVENKRFTYKECILKKEEAINLLLSRKFINSGPCAKMFKKKIVDSLEFPVLRTYEDILFVLNAFSNANTIAFSPKTQYHYIENIQGAMSNMSKAPSTDIIIASDTILEYLKRHKDTVDDECIYVTISHLFQYVLSMIGKESKWDVSFILEAERFYKKHMYEILSCKAVPIKERIVFCCFSYGWIYTDKRLMYVNKMEGQT